MSSPPKALVSPALGADLPPELFPLIIRHVQDRYDLRNCCLVAKAWCKFAQPRILSHLRLSRQDQCVQWARKFDTYPHLALNVNSLTFWGGATAINPDHGLETYAYVLDNQETVRLLTTLPNLTDIEISEFPGWLPHERDAILSCRNIQSFAMTQMTILATELLLLVHSMTHLQSLSLSELNILIMPDTLDMYRHLYGTGELLSTIEQESPRTPPLRLKHISLDEVHRQSDLLMWLLSPRFDLTGLKQVELSWAQSPVAILRDCLPHIALLERFLISIGTTVTDLVLDTRSQYSALNRKRERGVDFYLQHLALEDTMAHFTCLRTVVLKDGVSHKLGEDDSVSGLGISALLPSFASAPFLHQITLCLSLDPSPENGFSALVGFPEWERIDSVLSESGFPALRRFVVAFRIHDFNSIAYWLKMSSTIRGRHTREDAMAMMKECLPSLTASDRLRFDILNASD